MKKAAEDKKLTFGDLIIRILGAIQLAIIFFGLLFGWLFGPP
jgi:hypothetical protein